MYIKKSVLIICSAVLVVATFLTTVMAVNPFGIFQFDNLIKFKTGISALNKYYYKDIASDDLLDGALLGVAYSADDPYTMYMDKETSDSFVEDMESEDYTGVGVYISIDPESGQVIVISPLSGSPAEKAGLVPGDIIMEIDDEMVAGDNIDAVAQKIRGKDGTKVKFKIKKSDGQIVVLELTRETIKRETVSSKMIAERLAYIQISQFALNTATEFIEHFNNLAEQGFNRLVIDLRNNPGGYMDVAVDIADCFIEEGEIVYTLDKHNNKKSYLAEEGASKVKMAILTNGGTASASEVFVGAMKDYGLAKSVGTQTFGKGVTQIPYRFFDGSIMKITDSRYYTPNGICIDHEGITPDIMVEMEDEDYTDISELDLTRDTQLKAAVDYLFN